ncbi:MAG: hypothetical protein CBD58_01235 [bacterium TMED198]|nr:MAG: hypothetical protein CBD58_01235 [bacterium TMED198]|tara:strand:- start:1290 stop:1637 length:348 start_codon:yes stop_codon:yes gene_type:complete
MIKNKKHTTYLEEKVFPKLKIQRLPDPDKKVYGSKRINLIRISQEKRIKKLQLAMCRWGDVFKNTTEYDKSNWRENFTSVLRMEGHLSSGLNNTLSKEQLKLANRLYRKYLGFIK